ncbi:MAG: hypothetical protein V8Q82_06390 [Christensenellales bacterium]
MNRNTNTHHAMRIRVLSLLAALMLALGVLPAALAEDGQYGYVNFDNVRFRKQANDTVVWDKLNNGWVCKILGTKVGRRRELLLCIHQSARVSGS